MVKEDKTDRREFLRNAVTTLPILPVVAVGGTVAADDAANQKFQPEEYWRERIKAPDDGKKFGWFVDTRRCFGCHACEVSCKAENDEP